MVPRRPNADTRCPSFGIAERPKRANAKRAREVSLRAFLREHRSLDGRPLSDSDAGWQERYDALIEAEQDADDLAAAYAGRRSIEIEGSIPAAVSRRIREGMNPVAAWRRHADLTQAELAQRIGMTQAAIARIEALPPGAGRDDTLVAIARELGAPFASIAPVDPPPKGKLRKTAANSTDRVTGRMLRRA